jgi:tRNA threonylcarbamoyladenosine biosynthesis protein TsaE
VARTASAAETRALAAALAGVLRPGDLLLLVGDLGSGKTTFTQGLASGLGVSDPVTSPTFTLLRAYAGPGAIKTLFHADLYRLERLQDIVDLGLGEMVEDDSVVVVEWGDMAGSLFGPDVCTVRLGAGGTEDERTVTVEPGGSWSERAGDLARVAARWKG